jgi:hypothetical protein
MTKAEKPASRRRDPGTKRGLKTGAQIALSAGLASLAVASPSGSVLSGADGAFASTGAAPRFELAKIPPVPVGTSFVLTGVLLGPGGGNDTVALQASPYPYVEAFTSIGLPGMTNASGRFAFRVANLLTSTQFRVVTLDARSLHSPVLTVHAAVRVTLHLRSSARRGLDRLYGTVTPPIVGAKVSLQVEEPVGPTGQSEESTVFVGEFSTTTKQGDRTYSHFSAAVKVRRAGRYRAFVKLGSMGPLVSGFSPTVYLRAAAGRRKR